MLLSFAGGRYTFGKMAAKDFGYPTKDVPRASCALGPTKTVQNCKTVDKVEFLVLHVNTLSVDWSSYDSQHCYLDVSSADAAEWPVDGLQ